MVPRVLSKVSSDDEDSCKVICQRELDRRRKPSPGVFATECSTPAVRFRSGKFLSITRGTADSKRNDGGSARVIWSSSTLKHRSSDMGPYCDSNAKLIRPSGRMAAKLSRCRIASRRMPQGVRVPNER